MSLLDNNTFAQRPPSHGGLSASTDKFSPAYFPGGWPLGLALVSVLLALPIIVVATSVFQGSDGVWQHLIDTVLSEYILNSLILVGGVGVVVLALGIFPAWLVTMYRFPLSRVLEWALLLPMAIPAYIIAYTYTGMLDVTGPLQAWIRDFFDLRFGEYWFPEIRSMGGAIAMLGLVLYPYVYLLSRAAFLEQSLCVLDVSRTLGCSPRQAFFRVALPLARPAIFVGLSIVMMETLADYGTVQYFGISTFTTGIFRTWYGLGSSVAAAQLSALLMFFILMLVLLEAWSRRQQRFFHTSNRYSEIRQIQPKGAKKWLASSLCCLPVIVGFFIPLAQLVQWSLATYQQSLGSDFIKLALNSIGLATASAVAAMCLALFIAYGKRLYGGLLSTTAVRVISLGYALPGTVIAVGVLMPFAWLDRNISAFTTAYFDFNTGLLLSGTVFILIFAYMVRFLPVALNTVDAGLGKIKPSMDEAGRSMGLARFPIIKRIHLPMMKGSILTAALLVFVDVLKELPATLILRPFNFNTLAIRAYELANEERLAEAAAPALAIVLVGILPVFLLSRSISQSRAGND